jgi:4-hydroxy-tetrahydrodipicolinate reductase
MIRAIVSGAVGQMGSRIVDIISKTSGVELVGALERKGHPAIGLDIGAIHGVRNHSVIISDDLEKSIPNADVLIEFTQPEATLQHLEIAARHGVAMVVGTTGFSEEEKKKASSLAQKIPCVMAPNMSVGVNLLYWVLDYVARVMGEDYDVEIVEIHHNRKKDAPSGTALRMAEVIANARGQKLDQVAVYSRNGYVGEREKGEIGVQSVRLGDSIGEHFVFFGGVGERLELSHRVSNRDNFAKGAVRAAQWIVGKKKGLYDMLDVLGIPKGTSK